MKVSQKGCPTTEAQRTLVQWVVAKAEELLNRLAHNSQKEERQENQRKREEKFENGKVIQRKGGVEDGAKNHTSSPGTHEGGRGVSHGEVRDYLSRKLRASLTKTRD